MSGSNQAVSGRAPSCIAPRELTLMRRLLRHSAGRLLTIAAVLVVPVASASESGTPPSTAPAANRLLRPHGPTASDPTSLIGVGTRDLLDDGLLGSQRPPLADDTAPFEFPQSTSAQPVAIPFPTAVHLFIPGAIMAIYATRRFRGRRR